MDPVVCGARRTMATTRYWLEVTCEVKQAHVVPAFGRLIHPRSICCRSSEPAGKLRRSACERLHALRARLACCSEATRRRSRSVDVRCPLAVCPLKRRPLGLVDAEMRTRDGCVVTHPCSRRRASRTAQGRGRRRCTLETSRCKANFAATVKPYISALVTMAGEHHARPGTVVALSSSSTAVS